MRKFLNTSKIVNFAAVLFLALGLSFAIQMTANAAISAPSNVRQTDATDSRIYLQWAPSSVTAGESIYYYIIYGTDSTFTSYNGWERVSSSYTSDYVYQNLQAGSTYYVKVGASTSGSYGLTKPPLDTVWSPTVQMVTTPGQLQYTSIKQTAATETSIKLSWAALAGANGYEVVYYVQGTDSNTGTTKYTTTNSINITGLKKNKEYKFEIYGYRNNGTVKYAAYSGGSLSYVPTRPTKIKGVDCDLFDTSTSKGAATFTYDRNAVADGYEYQICAYNSTKVLVKGSTSSYYSSVSVKNSKLKARQFYRIRVRGYINLSGNQKSYGAWSDYEYFARAAGSDVGIKNSGGKIKASWNKVKGATNYTVYFSTNGNKYSKLTTTKKLNYTINKKISSDNYYYIRIVPNFKKGKVNYPGTINKLYNFYSAKVYTSSYGWWYYTD